jgi:predicted RNA methylase
MDQSPASADNTPLSPIARLKLNAELLSLVRQKTGILSSDPLAALKSARVASNIITTLGKLGVDLNAKKRETAAFELEGGPDLPPEPRVLTAKYFDYDDARTHGQRKKDNAEAMALLRALDKGEIIDDLDDAQKAILARYSGTGGNLVGADGKKGSAYEYYTPKPIASGCWDLLIAMGFKGGKVGDPCAGTGVFGACAPANAAMESVELNETSGRVNQLVNGGPGYNAIISPFEAVASRTADEIYDAVITNVPFGGVHDRGSNRKIDPKYQDQPLETYFILRSLEKLKPGGLAAFIVPPRVVSARGGREESLRIAASYMAEFRGAYRLPNSVFGTADADTITDVIVFRKYSREALNKIAELKEQNPGLLVETNVQWPEFIGGMYFKGEGKRFVLGEFQAKDPAKFRDVDRVISTASIGNIAKLLQKFPDSRVDWKLLNATETQPIVYNEGDTMTLAGQTLEMRAGVWVALGKAAEDDSMDGLGQVLSTPTGAVTGKVTWEQADAYVLSLRARSMDMDMPIWLRGAHRDIGTLDGSDRAKYWSALTAGLAAVELSSLHGEQVGFNYAEEYPVVSDALQAVASTAKKSPAAFTREGKAALQKVGIVYDRKTGFSAIWKGQGQAEVVRGSELTEDDKVEAVKYTTQGVTIDLDTLKSIYGDAFDPLRDDNWCVSADGSKATKADDYYIGNLADFLARLDAEIAAASGDLRDKLIRQRDMATQRIDKVDPSSLRFNLFSPFVDIEEKAEFLRRFMHPAFVVAFDDEGKKVIICDIKTVNSERERQFKRFAEYLKKGNLSTRTKDEEAAKFPELDNQRRAMLKEMTVQANAQFDQWVKANPLIMSRLQDTANDPARLYFTEVDDLSPVAVPGMNAVDPQTGDALTLKGYQNAYVRKQGRSFGGINGFDVGLGKTFTALAAAQYVQSIGVKKKTMFVLPNTVLSNWRREAGRAYADLSGCLFVGLDVDAKTGKGSVNSSNYARDFNRVLENNHNKIFCTLEAFKSIPLKDETTQAYEDYLSKVDPSYAGSEKNSDSERSESKLADVTGGIGAKSSAIPFFETMGVDSLIFDEGHMFKNSKNTVEFSGAKFLSVAEASQRGLDVQIKAWYVRGLSPLKDGVLTLTATPITNSPLEIYSMLCLAVGEQKVHDLCMGAQGADAFMDVMCHIEDDEEMTVDGRIKPYRVFRGLQNVDLLRNALAVVATIKNAEDVKGAGDDLKLPEAPEFKSNVKLSKKAEDGLMEYKLAYRGARESMKSDGGGPTEEELAALARVSEKFGEPLELIAHPFNLINKMTLLIADPELDERATFYTVAKVQLDTARTVMEAFNKLGKIELRALPGPHTDADAVVGSKIVRDGDSETKLVKIKVKAKLMPDGERIVIDTMDTNIQLAFETLADKAGLDLDCSIPPKLAALLENIRKEEANPRSVSGRVKQLIFCDVLSMHNKIKRLLMKHAGITSSAIAIVSGQTIKNPEQMQGIQDGFNAEGEENKYRVIIANEKAEVGINLQKGTQAIHHLTIGWTPDSVIQRDGRGVRQGNTTQRVNKYHYFADGTFDEYKRVLTSKKADWIGAVMDRQGGNDVAIAGGLSNKEYDELIDSMGDAGAIAAIRERAELKDKLQRADSARARQVINLKTAESQRAFVKQFEKPEAWISAKVMELYDLNLTRDSIETRLQDGKLNANSTMKLQARLADIKARMGELEREIDESASFEWYDHKTYPVNASGGVGDYLQKPTKHSTAAKIRESVRNGMSGAVRVKPESVLVNDWQAEVDAATRMADEAVKDFERIAKDQPGGYPAEITAAFKEGEVSIIDGKIYAKGMFVRDKKGNLAVIGTNAKLVRSELANPPSVIGVVSAGWTFIMFGTQEYEAALNEAAALDDGFKDVTLYNKNRLFSSVVPEVAKRRKKATRVQYSARDAVLPAPYLAVALRPDISRVSDVYLAIVEKQSEIIGEWTYPNGSAYFTAEADVAIETDTYNFNRNLATVVNYLKGTGQRFTMRDFEGALDTDDFVYFLTQKGNWPGNLGAYFDAANTAEELDALAQKMVTEALNFVVLPEEPLAGWMTMQARSVFNMRAAQIKAAETAAMIAKMNPAEMMAALKAEREAAPVAEPVQQMNDGFVLTPSVTPNSKGLIGIQGDTKPNKDTIKACAKEAGGYARWDGNAGQWNVPVATWAIIQRKFPAVAKLLVTVPA